MNGFCHIVLLAATVVVVLPAQEKTGTPEKKEPEARRVELPAAQQAQSNPQLPKIELPEFIITGIASINVPDVHKIELESSAQPADLSAYKANVGARGRETLELENRQKEFLSAGKAPVLNGQAVASLGTYFTPRLHLWLGRMNREYDYRVEAGYHRTKGYAANTDRSGGTIGVNGGVMFRAGALQGGRLGGSAAWGTEKYRFFGSLTPTARRTRSNALFDASVLSSPEAAFTWQANLGYRYDNIDDSAIKTE
ncbi:MAG: hypothetical protein ACRDGA_00155, partial [Bacteroidota bacterium]